MRLSFRDEPLALLSLAIGGDFSHRRISNRIEIVCRAVAACLSSFLQQRLRRPFAVDSRMNKQRVVHSPVQGDPPAGCHACIA